MKTMMIALALILGIGGSGLMPCGQAHAAMSWTTNDAGGCGGGGGG